MMESAWEGVLPGRHEHEALFEYVFRRFQEAEDLDTELCNVLRFMGSAARVGRVYLYEIDAERGEYRKTAEWCAEGIVPLTDEQERMRYPMGYTAWEKMYDNSGVLCIPDTAYIPAPERAITADLGVRAILQYKIESDGRVYGFIGMEDYNAPRIWIEEQIMGFHIFVKLLTLFLVKDRVQKRARNSEEALMTVLNRQDAWVYIIDKEYGIQFLNDKVKGLVPAGRERQRCYEVFLRRSSPCPGCPVAQGSGASAEIENPYLNLRLRTTATSIRWQGQDATLLRCTDASGPALVETAPRPNPIKTVLHPSVLQHTGGIDRRDPELMMAALQALMDHLPGMIFVKDLDFVYHAGNQAFADITNRETAQELLGKTDSEIFDDRQLALRYTSDDRQLLTGGRNLIDYVEPTTEEDGEARYNSTSKYILTTGSGRPVGLLGIARDVTQEVRAQYRRQEEANYLFSLPPEVFVARLIDIDDWRIIGQCTKTMHGMKLAEYVSVEQLLEGVRRGLHDKTAREALYFYEEFSPTQLRNLYNSGQSQLEFEHIFHFENGTSSWIRNEIKFLTTPPDGHLCAMLVARDIDSSRRTVKAMEKAANTDALTGSLSRGAGIGRIEQYLAEEGRDGAHAMFMIDIDNFKSVNDLFGHVVGDKLLRDVTIAIRSCFRDSDLVVRVGGDEFLVFVKNIPTYQAVKKKAEKLLRAVREVRPANTEAMISTSIGISLYPGDGVTHETLYAKADQALYRAKKAGKNQAAFASDEDVLYDGGNVAMSYEEYNSFAADHTGIYSYISDLKTRELLYMNHAAMTAHGIASPDGYQGRKCYEVLYGRTAPCPNCSDDKLQEGKTYHWTRRNETIGKVLDVAAVKVHINGRWCRLANARIHERKPGEPGQSDT